MKMSDIEFHCSLKLKSMICGSAAETKCRRRQHRKILATARKIEDPARRLALYLLVGSSPYCDPCRRKYDPSNDARWLLLAYGWLKGRTYRQIENKTKQPLPAGVEAWISTHVNSGYTYAYTGAKLSCSAQAVKDWIEAGDKSRFELAAPVTSFPSLEKAHMAMSDAA